VQADVYCSVTAIADAVFAHTLTQTRKQLNSLTHSMVQDNL